MRVLITAGPTREPIDPVRYLGNRSSGKMGIALAEAAVGAGHVVTLILGPVSLPPPAGVSRIDVETTRQMHDAVLDRFPAHDLLIMAAAVADFRPRGASLHKLERNAPLTLDLEATEDILAAAGASKRPDQRVIGFSLVGTGEIERSRAKLRRKNVDLLVHNPLSTLSADTVEATLLFPGRPDLPMPSRSKAEFADNLLRQAEALF